MIRAAISLRRKRVIVDIDTQKDYFLADGKACIRNHRRVLANIRRTIAWARRKNIRMISTAMVHKADIGSKGHPCVAGTKGQEKISYTLRNNRTSFEADGCTDLPREILLKFDQVILDKRCADPFDEPRADRMLSELRVDEFIIIGAITEDAIKATALGLLSRRKKVTILTDAVGTHNKDAAQVALRQMEAKGAKLKDTKALFGTSELRLVGACGCDRCRGKTQKKLFKQNTSTL